MYLLDPTYYSLDYDLYYYSPLLDSSLYSVEPNYGKPKTNYLINKNINTPKMNYTPNSIGINIPQMLVAGLEDAAITKGNMKNALVASVSVGVSNLLPSYGPTGMWSSGTEKYIAEPIIAGLLYSFGSQYLKTGDKEGSFIKRFGKGFIIGASSAAIGGQLVGSTFANYKPMSTYSSGPGGLRQVGVASVEAASLQPAVTTSYPSFVVS